MSQAGLLLIPLDFGREEHVTLLRKILFFGVAILLHTHTMVKVPMKHVVFVVVVIILQLRQAHPLLLEVFS